MIPVELPDELRAAGLPIEEGGDVNLAWDKTSALAALEAVRNSKIAVLSVDVYKLEAWGPIPTEESWSCRRLSGETASEFAERSRHWAGHYIATHDEQDGSLYLVYLDRQEGAA
jgi:hypothetical protein